MEDVPGTLSYPRIRPTSHPSTKGGCTRSPLLAKDPSSSPSARGLGEGPRIHPPTIALEGMEKVLGAFSFPRIHPPAPEPKGTGKEVPRSPLSSPRIRRAGPLEGRDGSARHSHIMIGECDGYHRIPIFPSHLGAGHQYSGGGPSAAPGQKVVTLSPPRPLAHPPAHA